MNIRRGRPQDLGLLKKLVQGCIEHMNQNDIPQWDEIYPHENDFIKDIQDGNLYVAVDYQVENQLILGCIVLNQEQDPTYKKVNWLIKNEPIGVVHRLMVEPASQGQGIARSLMEFIEKLALEQGFQTIRLDAFTKNPRALKFYDQLKYQRCGIVQLRMGPFVCFEKSIGS
jgi:GNAT superfamily N-acetyltransferase